MNESTIEPNNILIAVLRKIHVRRIGQIGYFLIYYTPILTEDELKGICLNDVLLWRCRISAPHPRPKPEQALALVPDSTAPGICIYTQVTCDNVKSNI